MSREIERCTAWLAINGWIEDGTAPSASDLAKCPCDAPKPYERLLHCRNCNEVIDCSDSEPGAPLDDIAWCGSCWQREELRRAIVRAEKAEADLAAARADAEDADRVREQLSQRLTRTANALKGPPPDLTHHSWHDLPEIAANLRTLERYVRGMPREVFTGLPEEWRSDLAKILNQIAEHS